MTAPSSDIYAVNTGLVTPGIPLSAYGCSLEGTRPVQPDPEQALEMPGVAFGGGPGVDLEAAHGRHRGGAQLGMAAGDYAVEVLEVGGQVQREAMADDRPVELDPDRRQLLPVAPDAGQPWSARLGVDTQLGEVLDQRPLQQLQVARDRQPQAGQVEHRVAHELARSVVRRLASPIRPDDLHPPPLPLVRVPQQVAVRRGLAQREDVGVLEQEEGVLARAF